MSVYPSKSLSYQSAHCKLPCFCIVVRYWKENGGLICKFDPRAGIHDFSGRKIARMRKKDGEMGSGDLLYKLSLLAFEG